MSGWVRLTAAVRVCFQSERPNRTNQGMSRNALASGFRVQNKRVQAHGQAQASAIVYSEYNVSESRTLGAEKWRGKKMKTIFLPQHFFAHKSLVMIIARWGEPRLCDK